MRMHSTLCMMVLLLAACASNPPVSELRQNVKNVTYMQHGVKPINYAIGVVNTKTHLSHIMLVGALSGVVQAGVATPERQFMESLLNNRPLTSEIAAGVMPLLANVLNLPYEPKQVIIAPSQSTLDQNGIFTWLDPNTDLVVVFSVELLTLTEKVAKKPINLSTISEAISPSAAFGLKEKEVAPAIVSAITIYKRDRDSRKLKQVWREQCGANTSSMPVTRKFTDLQSSPGLAKGMLDAAVPVVIDSCKQMLLSREKT